MSAPVLATSTPQGMRPDLAWPLLPVPGENGRIEWPALAQSVREMIEVVLRTTPGEQLLRPDFGAGLERMVHRPNTVTTRARMRDAITDALRRFERRILLDDVTVEEDADPNLVLVAIRYRLRHNGQPGAIKAAVSVGGA